MWKYKGNSFIFSFWFLYWPKISFVSACPEDSLCFGNGITHIILTPSQSSLKALKIKWKTKLEENERNALPFLRENFSLRLSKTSHPFLKMEDFSMQRVILPEGDVQYYTTFSFTCYGQLKLKIAKRWSAPLNPCFIV